MLILLASLGGGADAAPKTLYKARHVANARENAQRYPWAKAVVERWQRGVAEAMQRDRAFLERMIPELTPWPEYGQNCPACVGRLSAMGETGLYDWSVREPEKLTCGYCKTVYPNARYPETGAMTAPKMGQTFSFYLTDEERAHPEDRSGRHAFRWTGWPVHTSWSGVLRAQQSGWAVGQILPLAKLYAVTGEVKYAERAAWIMERLARVYPGWLFHSYDGTYADCPPAEAALELGRNPRGGKFPVATIITAFTDRHRQGEHAALNNGFWGAGRFGCSGSDGGMLLNVTVAYDLIHEARYPDGRPVLAPEAEKRIVNDLILAGCADTEQWSEINNKCGPGRALSAAVGILFQRPESVRRALAGFEALMEESFHFDGFCRESPSYSGMHLRLLQNIPEILDGYSDPAGYRPAAGSALRVFDPFQHVPRYRLALESMVRMLDPNHRYPVIGDTHAGNGLEAIYAEVLAAHYGARYAGLLEQAQGAPLAQAGSEYALWNRDPALKADAKAALPLRTEWFPGWHVGVLRGGAASGHTAFYFNGYEAGGHRHPDTLGIAYMAHGRELASDRGYMWDDPRKAWTGSTLAHNLVTVDGVNQNGKDRRSRLELFGVGPGVTVTQASATAYEQCREYRRTCALVELPGGATYAVDFFRVQGGKKHQYGLNGNGKLLRVEGADLQPLREEIPWLSNLRAAQPAGPVTAVWESGGVKLEARLLTVLSRLVIADAPGWRSAKGSDQHAAPIDQLFAERTDPREATSRFAAVLAPYTGERSPVRAARLILDDPASGAMAVAVELEGRTDYILSAPDDQVRRYGPITMAGRFGLVSVDPQGKCLRAYLLDGTELRCGDTVVSLPRPRTALRVASVADRTFRLAEKLEDGGKLVGQYLLAGDTGYEIESATETTITVRDYPAVSCDAVTLLRTGVKGGG